MSKDLQVYIPKIVGPSSVRWSLIVARCNVLMYKVEFNVVYT